MNKSLSRATVSLAMAKAMAAEAEKKAIEISVPVVISIVDGGAHTLLLQRMDDALVTSCDISLNKAWTACCMKQPTHALTEVVQPGQSLYGLALTNQQRIVIFGGGLPIMEKGEIIGAIGVSGGTVEQDMEIASAALDYFKKN